MPYTGYSQAPWIDDFAAWTLQMLGLQPTPWRMQFLETWSQYETGGGVTGTGPSYNPFGTTFWVTGATENVGGQSNVWHFPSVIEGAYATAQTIINYGQVMAALTAQAINNPDALAGEIGGSWGTGGFSSLVGSRWTPDLPTDVAVPTNPIPDRSSFLGGASAASAPPPSPAPTPAPTPAPPPPSSPAIPPRSAITPPSIYPRTPTPVIPQQPYVPVQTTPVYTPAVPVVPAASGGFPWKVTDITPGAGIPQTALTQGQLNVINLHEDIDVSRLQGWNAYTYSNGVWSPVTSGNINGIVGLNPTGMAAPH